MVNTKFEAYKLRRELKRIGKEFEFERPKLNAFKEPTNETTPIAKLTGLYHEYNGGGMSSGVSVAASDAAQVRSKKTPMILCLYEDAKTLKLGDTVKINSKELKVTGVVNIQEWNIIADISLEVVDDGIQN